MVNIYSSYNYCIYRRTTDSFFIDPILAKIVNKKKHQEKIFDVYKSWLESPFEYEPDLDEFDLNKLKKEFKKSFPLRLVEQNDMPESLEEKALYHLFQENINAFNQYRQILKKKDDFNEKMNIFTDCIRNDLKNLLKNKGKEKIEHLIDSPLRFYLIKMNNCINTDNEHIDYILGHEHAYIKESGHYENETWEIKDDLPNLMRNNWPKSTELIKNF